MKKYKRKYCSLYEAVLLEDTRDSFSEAYQLLRDNIRFDAGTDGTFINYLACDCPFGTVHQLHIGEYIVRGPKGCFKMSKEEFEKEFIETEEVEEHDAEEN